MFENEVAEVIETYSNRAKIRIRAGGSCQGCAIANVCLGGDTCKEIEVINNIGAKVGDNVKIDIDGSASIFASFLIFIFPLIFLIAGIFVGSYLSNAFFPKINKTLFTVSCSFIFLIISFLILYMLNKYFTKKKTFTPYIKEIIE